MNLSTSSSEDRGFLPALVVTALVVIGLVAWFNYGNDRWGIYSPDFVEFTQAPGTNRLALKTWYLEEHPGDYDCLILGSSRVEVLDSRRFPGHCYNDTHSGGMPRDHLRLLRRLLADGVELKNLYIGLDDLSYLQDPDAGLTQNERRPPPEGLYQSLLFNSDYLFHYPGAEDWEIFNGHLPKNANDWLVVAPYKHLAYLREKDEEFFADPEQHEQAFQRRQATVWEDGVFLDEAVADMRQIADLAREHGIALHVHFNPLHYKTYVQLDLALLEQFLREVSALVPVTDFTGLNAYSTDNRYWRETSHFATRLADLMLPEIIANPEERKLSRVLTAENFPAAIQEKRGEDARALLELPAFEGAHFIPPVLGQYLLREFPSRPLQGMPGGPRLHDLGPKYGRLVASVGDPYISWPSLCLPPGSAYLLKLRVDPGARSPMYVYSAGEGQAIDPFHGQRYYVDPGSQDLFLLLRDHPCGGLLRIDPFPARGEIRLLDSELFEIPLSGS